MWRHDDNKLNSFRSEKQCIGRSPRLQTCSRSLLGSLTANLIAVDLFAESGISLLSADVIIKSVHLTWLVCGDASACGNRQTGHNAESSQADSFHNFLPPLPNH